jgi:hypothetical protein
MSDLRAELIVVIRAAGERTLEACKTLVAQQVPECRVHVLSEQPFEAALRRCYELGRDAGTEWMMTLDGDVLLRPGAIRAFLAEAKQTPDDHVQVEGLLFDKLTGSYRSAGHRTYRTRHLALALQQVPVDRAEIRPEDATLRKMAALGFPSRVLRTVFGVHDYEQSYADVYAKAFLRATKSSKSVPQLVKHWKSQAGSDADYQVALRALHDRLASPLEARVDRRDYVEGARRALAELGLPEKPAATLALAEPGFVESILAAAGDVPVGRGSLQHLYRRLGLVRLVPYLVGVALSRAGERIKRYADR